MCFDFVCFSANIAWGRKFFMCSANVSFFLFVFFFSFVNVDLNFGKYLWTSWVNLFFFWSIKSWNLIWNPYNVQEETENSPNQASFANRQVILARQTSILFFLFFITKTFLIQKSWEIWDMWLCHFLDFVSNHSGSLWLLTKSKKHV